MWQRTQQRLQQDLPPHRLRNNICPGDHWQWISHRCHGLPEESQNHDGQVPAASLRGRPPVRPHAALLGRGCSQQLVLRKFPLCVCAHDLHPQPLQQRVDPRLHQPGQVLGSRACHQQPGQEEAPCEQGDLSGRVVACSCADRAGLGVCQGSQHGLLEPQPLHRRIHGDRGPQDHLPAHLPAGNQSHMDGRFPLPAHPGGLHPTRFGDPHLLLHHHRQAVAGLQGPGAEEESSKDHGHPHPLFFLLLAALLHRHLSGHPHDAERGPVLLRAAAGGGKVDFRHRGSGLFPLLPEPHPLRLPGS